MPNSWHKIHFSGVLLLYSWKFIARNGAQKIGAQIRRCRVIFTIDVEKSERNRCHCLQCFYSSILFKHLSEKLTHRTTKWNVSQKYRIECMVDWRKIIGARKKNVQLVFLSIAKGERRDFKWMELQWKRLPLFLHLLVGGCSCSWTNPASLYQKWFLFSRIKSHKFNILSICMELIESWS